MAGAKEKYDVFISFRGVDTRETFTCHLTEALRWRQIITYTDDLLETGDRISPTLLGAIEESKLAVIVFSIDYASSWWCLEELVHIMKCKGEHRIIPVFHGIEPSYARRLKGRYTEAFDKHRLRYPADQVKDSSDALTRAADLSAIVSNKFRLESKLVEKIVEVVLKKLNEMPYSRYDFSNLVGIEEHIRKLKPLLRVGSPEFRIIGIRGMIGIGKTTIATVLYDQIRHQFDGFYFLANVAQEAKAQGWDHLRNNLLAGLLGEANLNLGHQSSGSTTVIGRVCRKKVLVVLDGVEDEDQLDKLLPSEHIEFDHPESRIIVTTRNVRVLNKIGAKIYEVNELNYLEAQKVFEFYAFDKNSNVSDYADLSEKVIKHHAGGVPLALKTFGFCLRHRKSREAWEIALEKWESVPNDKIQQAMRLWYDSLDDKNRNIFLDIACFFRGEDRNFIERILHGCEFFPKVGISDLIDNSLLTCTHCNKITMHDLLQRMGQEIVREESEKEPENRSRLWLVGDICDILEKNTGTAKLHGIFLDTANSNREVHTIPSAAFSNMHNLRLLKIFNSRSVEDCKVYLPDGLESLPNSLVYFHWHSYPLKSLPSNFAPNHLVELSMPYSKLENPWPTGVQHLGNLKRIDLSYSEHLTQIPDLSQARRIESVNLERCTSLLELPSYISNLDELNLLNLKDCSSLQKCLAFPRKIKSLDMRNCVKLRTLPDNVCDLECLWHLNLAGCCQLTNFPEISRPMRRLEYLILDRTSIEELPSSIKYLVGLKILSLNMCKNLQVLPVSISYIYTLQRLNLSHCSNLKSLPELPESVSWVDARYCTLLETVSNSRAQLRHVWNIFVFYNCLNLDRDSRNNIMADAQLRILQSATMAREDGESKTPDDEICFPGDEIPEWFEHKNVGHEINVELDHQAYWCNQNFLGFAFCVVVDFEDVSSDTDFQLHCESQCIFPDGTMNKWSRSWTWHWNDLEENSTNLSSSHIFLFHDYCCKTYWNFPIRWEASSSNSTLTTNYWNKSSATFSFRPQDSMGNVGSWNCQVQCCGVRLLYTDDLEKSRLISDRRATHHSKSETVVLDPLVPIERRGHSTHATNIDYRRRPISCECLVCCSQFREICDRLLGYVLRPVDGSVTSGIVPALWEKLEKVETDLNNLQSGINRVMAQNEQIVKEFICERQILKHCFEMNYQAQTAR